MAHKESDRITGQTWPRSVYDFDNTVFLDLTSLTAVSLDPEVGVHFIAPPSGAVVVTVGSGLRADGTNRISVSVQVFADDSNGVEVVDPNTTFYRFGTPRETDQPWFGCRVGMIEGLDPGRQYYARVMCSVTGGAACDVFTRDILVEPAP